MTRTQRLNVQQLEAREVPASDLIYALQLTGLSPSTVTRVVADPIGNVYVAGNFTGSIDLNPDTTVATKLTSRGGTDAFVAKYSNAGKLLWARQLGGQANDSVSEIALDGAANVYVGGTFNGAVDFNPAANISAIATASSGGSGYLWKLGYNGNFVMARTVGGKSSVTSIAVDGLGRILATGQFYNIADFNPVTNVAAELSTTNEAGASFVWKLDQTGAYIWARAFQSTGTIQTTALVTDASGFGYLAGRFNGTADLNPSDAAKDQHAAGTVWTPFVVKMNFLGEYVWGKPLRTTTAVANAPTNITAIGVDGIGGVYTAGVFAGTADFDPGAGTVGLTSAGNLADGFVWKLNGDGTLNYARRFGGDKAETVSDLAVDKAGFAYVTGGFSGIADFDPSPSSTANIGSGAGTSDAYVLKLTRAGNLAYTRALGGGSSTSTGSSIFADGIGNMYLTGGIIGTGDFNPNAPVRTLPGGTGSGFIAKLFPSIDSPAKPSDLPPINVSTGGPYVTKEGDGLTVQATGADPEGKPLVFNWDLNGDGIYGDAFGRKLVLTRAKMLAVWLGDGTGQERTIRVRVGDGVNLPVIATGKLTINNVAPVAKIVVPESGKEGVRPQVRFKILNEFAPKDIKTGFRASWDFNDDGVWDAGDGSSYAGSVAGGQTIPMRFVDDAGPIAVRVRVFDKDGGWSESTGTIDLIERPPTAMFSLASQPRVGMPTLFAFSNQNDAPADKEAKFKYAYDFNNDGIFEVQSDKPQASAVFPGRGSFAVNGAIIDKDGTFNVYQLIVNVMF